MASSLSKTSCADAAVPFTVSPVTSPWSATASRVFSGIVFTVSGATSSVTYRVSEWSGFLTPAEAHSGRCTRAPSALSASNRSPPLKTFWYVAGSVDIEQHRRSR